MAASTLMTGASGLIGGWTLRHWTAVPPRTFNSSQIDLLEPGAALILLEGIQPDVVVHLAWCASGTPGYRDSDDNEKWLATTVEIARLCVDREIALFCTGSVVDDSLQSDSYARSKRALRKELAADIDAGRITWLRPHYVFDPDAGRPSVIAHARAAAENGRPVRLASPTSEHDFVHASDVGSAIALAVGQGLRGVVEIGCGRTRTVGDLVSAMGLAWVPGQPTPVAATPPARIDALLAAGWSADLTQEFFADG